MLTPRRRVRGPRAFTTSLALAAAVVLAVSPAAAAQSTAQADGAIAVSSLSSTTEIPGSVAGSLGSLAGPAYAEYVALGDSYAAFGDDTKPAGGPAGCARSLANYPHQLDANAAVGALTDATCGGAQTKDILVETQFPGAPPQIESLEADTDLVTLSIGGNDVGFGTIVGCITAHLRPDGPAQPFDCRETIGGAVAQDIALVFGADGAVDDVYAAIDEASPNATVVATQYLPLMPAANDDGCFFTTAIGPANLEWAREITKAINDAVDAAARRNGHFSVLPVSDTDRSGCAPVDERWVVFADGSQNNTAAFHPTALGQQAMAAAITAAI
ncbi:SGNH/GDSL hydrolase family protein [Dietzia sp. ANT_WB102]|uniref:SGNH/GDSL hydrolase family protein n=1 Tax=Dietzia sp. ANT_WB102 TaxID=2597345 RepID=UPI0011EF7661|nr:SGNH/GDSL hydrolase family protein [Dietzia sp. ANT_WB102]KAA0918690.1 SGNH/GDSL hydrolase family protein [Dietzia sp. ANT_WB102]